MTYKLQLIQTKDGTLLLEGSHSGETLEYYDVDGEGGEATSVSFTPWNQEVKTFSNVATDTYEDDDTDSFWSALSTVLASAREQGIELPAHNALDA